MNDLNDPEPTLEELLQAYPLPWEVDPREHPVAIRRSATIFARDSTLIRFLRGPHAIPLALLIAKSVNEVHYERRDHGVRLRSGATGWRMRAKELYASLDAVEEEDGVSGILGRLGFATAEDLWEVNPVLEGGTDPADFRISPGTLPEHPERTRQPNQSHDL